MCLPRLQAVDQLHYRRYTQYNLPPPQPPYPEHPGQGVPRGYPDHTPGLPSRPQDPRQSYLANTRLSEPRQPQDGSGVRQGIQGAKTPADRMLGPPQVTQQISAKQQQTVPPNQPLGTQKSLGSQQSSRPHQPLRSQQTSIQQQPQTRQNPVLQPTRGPFRPQHFPTTQGSSSNGAFQVARSTAVQGAHPGTGVPSTRPQPHATQGFPRPAANPAPPRPPGQVPRQLPQPVSAKIVRDVIRPYPPQDKPEAANISMQASQC